MRTLFFCLAFAGRFSIRCLWFTDHGRLRCGCNADAVILIGHFDGIPDVEAESLQPFSLHGNLRSSGVVAFPASGILSLPCPCAVKNFHFL